MGIPLNQLLEKTNIVQQEKSGVGYLRENQYELEWKDQSNSLNYGLKRKSSPLPLSSPQSSFGTTNLFSSIVYSSIGGHLNFSIVEILANWFEYLKCIWISRTKYCCRRLRKYLKRLSWPECNTTSSVKVPLWKTVKSTPEGMQVDPHALWGKFFQPMTEITDLIEQFLFATNEQKPWFHCHWRYSH